MLEGKLIEIDTEQEKGKIEQNGNNRIYDFELAVWNDENGEPEVGAEVEFEVEMRVVTKVKINPKPVDPDEIPMTKLPNVCIEEFFSRENGILENYKDFMQSHSSLDFLRMRRFLLTAYNDLCEMDNLVENEELRKLKIEINRLFRDFEEYVKKAKYTPAYAFEKIFLARQIEFLKVQQDIESTQVALANAKAQLQVLGSTLENQERKLQRLAKNGREYLLLEKEVKMLRKTYVDLIQFVATRQEFLVYQNERIKKFKEAHFQEFVSVYAPMLKMIKDRFVMLLDSKAYDLDSMLWERAKQSQNVRRFFRDARIEGGFSSKTFLRYFLRGFDRGKASAQTKELFNLLKYLEEKSHKDILVLRSSKVDALRCKEIIEKIDSTLSVSVDTNPINALKGLMTKPQDIIVLDEYIGNMKMLDFVANANQIAGNKPITFCVIVKKMPDYSVVEEAKKQGVGYFIPDQNIDALFDSVRMAL